VFCISFGGTATHHFIIIIIIFAGEPLIGVYPLSWTCRQAEFSPWLSGWRFASRVRVRSQVWRGRPERRLQSLGIPRIDVCRALNRSCVSPIRAAWPKERSRLVWMSRQLQWRAGVWNSGSPATTTMCGRLARYVGRPIIISSAHESRWQVTVSTHHHYHLYIRSQ